MRIDLLVSETEFNQNYNLFCVTVTVLTFPCPPYILEDRGVNTYLDMVTVFHFRHLTLSYVSCPLRLRISFLLETKLDCVGSSSRGFTANHLAEAGHTRATTA